MRATLSRVLLLGLALSSSCSLFEGKVLLHPRGSFLEGRSDGLIQEVHAPGVRCELECAFVEERSNETRELPQRGFQATLHIENRGEQALLFDWSRIELVDDRDLRYRPSNVLYWNEEEEEYQPAASALQPGETKLLVLMFPVQGPLKLQHIYRVTLHWGYRLGAQERRIRSPFLVP
ncbi:MAG: hypothetical protein CSA62_15085 [Planctomycetota bacterium]|nr:MAG: hypothetical protein CSA62_15085 [Planctomycetota bacterium]